jgi:serine/threonine protein kinase
MSVLVIPCGPAVNQSEELAAKRCKAALERLGDSERWVVLSNLAFSGSPLRQSDDLDLVCIGPRGVVVIEVKHWDGAWVKENPLRAEAEADKLTAKVRRLGGYVRKLLSQNETRVEQWLLFTREGSGNPKPDQIRGVPIATLKTLGEGFNRLPLAQLSATQVDMVVQGLEPRARVQLDGRVRRIADYHNLELSSPTGDRFHRMYRGVHHRTKEKVILHLYDLSASEEKEPRRLAEREFRALQLLQKSQCVPRFRDSLQDLPDYPGELCFFTQFDPEAPSVNRRAGDVTWTAEQRVEFAAQAFDSLREVHGLTDDQSVAVVHRNLSPETVLVAARNMPLFSGFQLARLPLTQTLASAARSVPSGFWVAPEVRTGGLAAATAASDVFSLSATLSTLFEEAPTSLGGTARAVLEAGQAAMPADRQTLDELSRRLRQLLSPAAPAGEPGIPTPEAEFPAAEFWCDGVEVPFQGLVVRVVARLGSGGIGRTFKVEHVDPVSGENYGTYVAKVIRTREAGEAARRAYNRVRSHSVSPGLSTVFDVAERWEADRVVALLRWLDGESLDGLCGVLSVAAEDCGEESVETLLRRWLREVCGALAALHENSLVHGDVSPRNLIHHRGGLTLTDFDLVTSVGHAAWCCGARAYCSPEAERCEALVPSDDLFALAATFFEAAFSHSPFIQADGALDKSRGLYWRSGERESLPQLAEFLDRATDPDRSRRFAEARAVLAWLDSPRSPTSTEKASTFGESITPPPARTEQVVEWLNSLLRVYPGSPHGNVETRGLDSDFAVATYVPTPLENELHDQIKTRCVRLVVLCGNAGDGKTALLQRLASSFGVDRLKSATRIWEARTHDGLLLRANLDGSAAWQGRSSNDLLTECFDPFLDGPPSEDIAHLLAINDGRLLEWLENRVRSTGESALTQALSSFLASDDDPTAAPSYVRFISLNHRSLVGGRVGNGSRVTTDFLDQLIAALLGGEKATERWDPCLRCTAWERCTAGPTAHRLLATMKSAEWLRGQQLRKRLAEALQAVHQRGNVHITTRELRGTLSYILFGVRSCRELHDHPDQEAQLPGDMAFDPSSPFRQGELLRELAELDPALEAHPHLDRWLTGRSARELPGAGPFYPSLTLESARRRAYFEWTRKEIETVTGDPDSLGLATGEHLQRFHMAALRDAEQNTELCAEICRGISHLENLPRPALRRPAMVALRIPSRTPTETVFWVEKPLERFRLEPELAPVRDAAIPMLPRRLRLIYRCVVRQEETLVMGYSLFHTLLSLAGGEQLNEERSDDLFANLQIFTQRIAQEDEAHLLCWHPKADESVFRIGVRRRDGRQVLACEPAGPTVDEYKNRD